jgi:hypothetical protein
MRTWWEVVGSRGIAGGVLIALGGIVACSSDAMDPAGGPSAVRDHGSWRTTAARAIAEGGVQGLVGVQLRRDGTGTLPVRILGGTGDAAALRRANEVLSQASRGVKARTSGLSFSVADPGFFLIAPSGTTGSTTTYQLDQAWGCADESTQGFWQPTTVIIDGWQQKALPNTGGHLSTNGAHPIGSKPLGYWSATSAATGPDGVFSSTFTSGPVAGEETVDYTVTGVTRCTGTTSVNGRYSIALADLTPIVNGINGISVPSPTSAHTSVSYATFSAANASYLTQAVYAGGSGDFIRVTAASLPEGGLNDIAGTWAPPHSTHRSGAEVDMVGRYKKDKVGKDAKLVPDANALEAIAAAGRSSGFAVCDVETSRKGVQLDRTQWHVHCTTP